MLACYAKYVASGCNCNNKSNTRSDTVKGYLEAVNDLFVARNFNPPVDLSDISNPASTIVKNLKEEEDVAKRRDPITSEIYAEILKQAKEAEPGSEKWLLGKLANVAKFIGPRSCEYAQKKNDKVEYHTYPSGKKVVKAFTREDLTFLDKKSSKLDVSNPESRKLVAKVRIRWRIQKNRQNGQVVTVKREWLAEDMCGVLALWDVCANSIAIGQTKDMPIFATKAKAPGSKIKYLTAGRIATLLRNAAKAAHEDITKDELSRLSSHSFRVWACVLLSEAGMSSDFIKKRLRWMGDSYQLYLRDTDVIHDQHSKALSEATARVLGLLQENLGPDVIPEEVAEDNEMGNYEDFED